MAALAAAAAAASTPRCFGSYAYAANTLMCLHMVVYGTSVYRLGILMCGTRSGWHTGDLID